MKFWGWWCLGEVGRDRELTTKQKTTKQSADITNFIVINSSFVWILHIKKIVWIIFSFGFCGVE